MSTELERNKYRQFNEIGLDLRKLIFRDKSLQSILFNRRRFLEEGLTFKTTQFTDEHLAGLLKMNFKQEQLYALQRSMKNIMGIKLTTNLKKNLNLARNIGLKDAGCAGEITCGQFETAKFWKYKNIKLTCELLIRRAKQNAFLAKHTNQNSAWKFSIGSDKAGGVHYTHIILQNTLQPAASKTSLTITGIYDTKSNFERNQKILNSINKAIAQLHRKVRLQVNFPKMTRERLDELKKIHKTQPKSFIEKQINAKRQLEKKIAPNLGTVDQFQPPIRFDIIKSKQFIPVKASEIRSLINRNLVFGTSEFVEHADGEVQELDKLAPETKLTICPLDCRAFLTPNAAAKYTILMYENFNLDSDTTEKIKFESPLKSKVDVRVTNLSKLLLNLMSETQILVEAQEIVNRQRIEKQKSPVNKSQLEIANQKSNGNKKINFHVSHVCKECESSKEHETPPILMEIMYEGQSVNWKIEFNIVPDGAELVDLAGITKGLCYKCELPRLNPKIDRGRKFGRQHMKLVGEMTKLEKPRLRTLKRANKYSRSFKDSETKNITDRRRENFGYERAPTHQYAESIETAQDPEFHTRENIMTKRVYNRGLEYVRLIDAHLLEEGIVQKTQQTLYNEFKKVFPAYQNNKNQFSDDLSKIQEKINLAEMRVSKAKAAVKKFPKGDRSEAGKRARKKRSRQNQKLKLLKRQRGALQSKFENAATSKKMKKVSQNLLKIPGPRETKFLKLGVKQSMEKGGSLGGRESNKVLKSNTIMKVIFEQKFYKNPEGKFIIVGNSTILKMAQEYLRLRKTELSLTCHQRSFCDHEISKIKICNASASRLEAPLYSDQIMLMSTHFREHLIETLIKNKELIARDSTTEFLNQRQMKREAATKYSPNFNTKSLQMNQRQHTEATAPEFSSRRKRSRNQTSSLFPDPEDLSSS